MQVVCIERHTGGDEVEIEPPADISSPFESFEFIYHHETLDPHIGRVCWTQQGKIRITIPYVGYRSGSFAIEYEERVLAWIRKTSPCPCVNMYKHFAFIDCLTDTIEIRQRDYCVTYRKNCPVCHEAMKFDDFPIEHESQVRGMVERVYKMAKRYYASSYITINWARFFDTFIRDIPGRFEAVQNFLPMLLPKQVEEILSNQPSAPNEQQKRIWELEAQLSLAQVELSVAQEEIASLAKRMDPLKLYEYVSCILPLFSNYIISTDPTLPINPSVRRVLDHPGVQGTMFHVGDWQLRVEVQETYIDTDPKRDAFLQQLCALVGHGCQPSYFLLKPIHGERRIQLQ